MTIYNSTGPLLIAVRTPKYGQVPPGHVHVTTVTYEDHVMPGHEFENTKFKVHDANLPQAKIIAELVAL